MAFLDEIFDINDLPESDAGNYDALPAGWYSACVKNVEVKATKSGTGQYFAVRYDIEGPTHQGRVIFGNLNVKNANPKAEEIGRKQLRELMAAAGIDRMTNTDQLMGARVSIKVAVTESEQYGKGNDIKAIKPAEGAIPAIPATVAKAAPAATAKAAPPWAKK